MPISEIKLNLSKLKVDLEFKNQISLIFVDLIKTVMDRTDINFYVRLSLIKIINDAHDYLLKNENLTFTDIIKLSEDISMKIEETRTSEDVVDES